MKYLTFDCQLVSIKDSKIQDFKFVLRYFEAWQVNIFIIVELTLTLWQVGVEVNRCV